VGGTELAFAPEKAGCGGAVDADELVPLGDSVEVDCVTQGAWHVQAAKGLIVENAAFGDDVHANRLSVRQRQRVASSRIWMKLDDFEVAVQIVTRAQAPQARLRDVPAEEFFQYPETPAKRFVAGKG